MKSRDDNQGDPETNTGALEPVFVGRIRATVNPRARIRSDGILGESCATDKWVEAQRNDPTWKPMIEFLEDKTLPTQGKASEPPKCV